MISITLEEAKKLSKGNTIIPISLELFADVKTPIEVLKNMRRKSDHWYILESISAANHWGRYSFLGYEPAMSIYGMDDRVTIKKGSIEVVEQGAPLEILRDKMSQYKSPRISSLPPFTGGFVGYFAYDFVKNLIPGLKLNAADETCRDFHFMLMDKIIAFDHLKQKIYIIVNIATKNLEKSYAEGIEKLKEIKNMILETTAVPQEATSSCGKFTSSFTEESFGKMVETVKKHIVEGDIFQAVISNQFQAPFQGNLMNTYRLLRTINPSPYMVYMHLDDMEIACASPETLVSIQDGMVSSFPLAGTCKRGKTKEEDASLIEALLKDEKELAEHDMLVDLARNDLGKISKFSSVKVCEYRQVKEFSHVSHIASHVTGQLREDKDPLDVIQAAMPAGTLSGAPKKRACEIIDKVEGVKRGVYGGALGYIDFTGNMDVCIGIRMAVLKEGNVYVQSGAGIVAESDPKKEYMETKNKAQAVMNALKQSGEVRA